MESFIAAHLGEQEVEEEMGGEEKGKEYSDSRSIQIY